MSDDATRLEELRRQLRDERRLRDAAERRAAKQTESARVWRDRAEARMERIDRLVAQREERGSLLGRVRANLADLRRPLPDSDAGAADDAARHDTADGRRTHRVPRLAHVQLGHLVDDLDLRRVVAETTGHDLAASTGGLYEADLVVVEAAALAAADDDVRAAFEEWERLDARQALLWHGPAREFHGPTVVIGTDAPLPPTFDPAVHTPVGRPSRVDPASLGEAPPVGSRAFVEAAARARAFAGDDDPVRAADLRRRTAWATNHPAAVGAALLDAADLVFEGIEPSVAAVLVSNRPDDLRRQLLAMPAQRHRPLEVAVGCHGFSSSEVREQLAALDGQLPVRVHDLPGDRPLGWCLNRVIEQTTSAVLAKIDDDDHYGPGYLVDALQALEYADAAIVGRVGAFTHLEGEGRTVLRRERDEERHYTGTLIGATMVVRRSAWERSPFAYKTLAEDVSLQRAVQTQGERMYSAGRWDFVYRRRAGGQNTWRAPDDHFLAQSEDAWEGWHPTRANLDPADA